MSPLILLIFAFAIMMAISMVLVAATLVLVLLHVAIATTCKYAVSLLICLIFYWVIWRFINKHFPK